MARQSTAFSVPLPPTDDEVPVELIVVDGVDQGRCHEVVDRVVAVGSSEGMDLVLSDAKVSGRHMSVERADGHSPGSGASMPHARRQSVNVATAACRCV